MLRFRTSVGAALFAALAVMAPGCAMEDATSAMGAPSGSSGGAVEGNGNGAPSAGQLTAGEWNDLDHWDFWLGLNEPAQPTDPADPATAPSFETAWDTVAQQWSLDVRNRVSVKVTSAGEPLADAEVVLLDAEDNEVWAARSDNKGMAHLFAGLNWAQLGTAPYSVVASAGDAVGHVGGIESFGADTWFVNLEGQAQQAEPTLDVAFVVDTTGSMGDELRFLKAELADVIARVQQNAADVSVRVGLSFYRDRGDQYLVRSFDFQGVDGALADLGAQASAGGGDYPEAVDEALLDMVEQQTWSSSARARLMFVVLDAPTHGQQDDQQNLHNAIRQAAQKGIRLIPVVASGWDRQAEFVFRAATIATGGTYTFLTDHSGIGNDHLEPTVGDFEVEKLNDLLVRVISERIAP